MRLQRIGRKNSPSYRVVVVDSHQGPKSGKYVDQLGSYDPKSGVFQINAEKAVSWIGKGTQVSPTVHNMLISKSIIKGEKITVKAPKKEEAPKPEGPRMEEMKAEEPVAEEVAA